MLRSETLSSLVCDLRQLMRQRERRLRHYEEGLGADIRHEADVVRKLEQQIALLSCSSPSSCHLPTTSTCAKCSGPLVHDHYSEAVRSKVTERRADSDRKKTKKTSRKSTEVAVAAQKRTPDASFRAPKQSHYHASLPPAKPSPLPIRRPTPPCRDRSSERRRSPSPIPRRFTTTELELEAAPSQGSSSGFRGSEDGGEDAVDDHEDDWETRLRVLNAQVDLVSAKAWTMLARASHLGDSSRALKDQVAELHGDVSLINRTLR